VDVLGNQHANKHSALILLFLFCFLGAAAGILLSIRNYFILNFREKIGKDLSLVLLQKLQRFSHNFFYNSNVSEIAEINNVGQEAIHGFLVAFLSDILPFLFEFTLILVVVVSKVNLAASIPLLVVFISYFLISLIYSPKERKSNLSIREAKGKTVSQFYENIINFDSIKIINAEKPRLKLFSDAIDQVLLRAKSHGKLFFDKSLLQNTILYIGLFLTLTISMLNDLTPRL
jgi:ABC-type bacteriocin/lantibiotic exporter with double-glycine peptidase domain